jgi:hypothetical protein
VAVDAGLSSTERERLASLLNPPSNKETAKNADKKSKQEKQ